MKILTKMKILLMTKVMMKKIWKKIKLLSKI